MKDYNKLSMKKKVQTMKALLSLQLLFMIGSFLILIFGLLSTTSFAFVIPETSRLPTSTRNRIILSLSIKPQQQLQHEESKKGHVLQSPQSQQQLVRSNHFGHSITSLALIFSIVSMTTISNEAYAASTVSPTDPTTTTYSKGKLQSQQSSTQSEPPAKKALATARNQLDIANTKVLQAQRDLTAAKSYAQNVMVSMSKAESAAVNARRLYIDANEKLLSMRSDRSIKESAIILQQQKVADLQKSSKDTSVLLEKAKSSSRDASNKVKDAESILTNAMKQKTKAIDQVKIADKNYVQYQKQVAETEKKNKKLKEEADKRAKKQKEEADARAKKQKEEAEKRAKIQAKLEKERLDKIAKEKAIQLAKEKQLIKEKEIQMKKQISELENQKRAIEQKKIINEKLKKEKEYAILQQQKQLELLQQQQKQKFK
jgi:hypothetical protein